MTADLYACSSCTVGRHHLCEPDRTDPTTGTTADCPCRHDHEGHHMDQTKLVFVDTETTGLDPATSQVWEIGWAYEHGPVESFFVPHTLVGADPNALEVGRYDQRFDPSLVNPAVELDLVEILDGATLVAANPAFDANMLERRWGVAPWSYRLLDIESYAMGALGLKRPSGLNTIADTLRSYGFTIPDPDHSAAGDVLCLRECYRVLTIIYGAGLNDYRDTNTLASVTHLVGRSR